MTDETTSSGTLPSKADDDVGKPGPAPAGGGRQTAEQAAITQIDGGGQSDRERGRSWSGERGRPGRTPSPVGGASGGHAEQTSADDADGKTAAGHYEVEKPPRSTDRG